MSIYIYIYLALYWNCTTVRCCNLYHAVMSTLESVGVRGKPLMAFGLEPEPDWFKKKQVLGFYTALVQFTTWQIKNHSGVSMLNLSLGPMAHIMRTNGLVCITISYFSHIAERLPP